MNSFFEKILEWLDSIWFIKHIEPWELGVRLTDGRYHGTLKPGWHLMFPLIGAIYSVEAAEQAPDIRCGTVTTKDGIDMAIGTGVLYKIINPRKAVMEAINVDKSLETVVLGTVHAWIHARDAKNCTDFTALEAEILKEIREYATERWGIKVIRVWITDSGNDYTRIITDAGKEIRIETTEGE